MKILLPLVLLVLMTSCKTETLEAGPWKGPLPSDVIAPSWTNLVEDAK